MEKKSVNRGLIFLLIFLVVVGIFFLYSRLTPTGYVTKVINATTGVTLSSNVFDEGEFSNTLVSGGDIVLLPTKTTGTYVSQVFNAGQNVFWTNFVYAIITHSSNNYTEDPLNNSIVFYVRSCNDSACTGKDFVLSSENPSLVGQYFQYKAVMQIFSGNESPTLSEVNVSYYPPMSLPINIESPQSIVYITVDNESIIPIRISSINGSNILFSYNGTNETYPGGEVNRTFSQGSHVLTAWVIYSDGNINYVNSTTVSFSILRTFYRFTNNACSVVNITSAQKTASDYNTLTECQTHITTTNTTTTTTTTETQTTEECLPSWVCENWSECVDGIQTRICIDTNTECTIVSEEGKPPEEQFCEGGITTAAIEEEGEEVVSEQPTSKGFFSFVGSAIVGPIFRSKIGVVFVVLLILIIGGLLAYKFFLKDKLKLKLFTKKKFLSIH